MKFTTTVIMPLNMNREEAIEYLGSVKLFTDMEENGWIKPLVQKTRFVLYGTADLQAANDRFRRGEYPGEVNSRR